MGLAYIARTRKELDKKIVMLIILKEYKGNKENIGIIENPIDDIETFLN
jgi:hypothetical protein